MDKISAVLILGIVALVMANGWMMYDTYRSPEILVCNDDTSITNHSDKRLWLRVKAESVNGKDAGDYRIESEAIAEGSWLPDEEGWYYYSMPLDFAQSTEPFAEAFFPAGNTSQNMEKHDVDGSVRLRVEAVDEAWLPWEPGCGVEAFDLFKRAGKPPEILYL